jgi:uncharacterized protein YaeQ
MSGPATLYRFRISVSDIERSFYEDLDFRAAMHPSENEAYLLTRVLAYALNYESGLEFAPGLCTGDEPAIHAPDGRGGIGRWIEIGNPAPRKLHKAAKSSSVVRVYTYKDPENLKREAARETIHRASEIEIFALKESFLAELAALLKRDNSWTLIHDQGELVVTVGDESAIGRLEPHRLAQK